MLKQCRRYLQRPPNINTLQCYDKILHHVRELSFLKLGTGVEEFLEGYQIFWPRFIGVSNISEKIVKYLMGCEIFGVYFSLK